MYHSKNCSLDNFKKTRVVLFREDRTEDQRAGKRVSVGSELWEGVTDWMPCHVCEG